MLTVSVVPLIFEYRASANYLSYPFPKMRALLGLMALAGGSALILRRRGRYSPSPLDIPLFVYALAIAIATVFSVDPWVSFWGRYNRREGFLTLIAYLLVTALTARYLKSKPQVQRWIGGLFIGSAIVIAYGIAQYFGLEIIPNLESGGRSFATMGNPDFLAMYLVLVQSLAMTLFLYGSESPYWLIFWGITTGTYLTLLMTLSRAGWLGIALSGVMIVWMGWPRLKQDSAVRRRLAILATSLALVTVLFEWPGGPFSRPGLTITTRILSTGEVETSGVSERLWIWYNTVLVIVKRPLIGWGPETLSHVFPYVPQERYLEFVQRWGRFGIVDRAHNDFLHVAASTGLIGLASYIWVLVRFFRVVFQSIRGSPWSEFHPLLIGSLGGAVGYLATLQFHFSVIDAAPVFWSTVGLASGLAWSTRRRQEELQGFGNTSDYGSGEGSG
ncbi:MAG: O-antigen ligase family protein [Armatimonadota bacterium]|nr:O-antigen ligase family protein [Armatimonadota bacterium]